MHLWICARMDWLIALGLRPGLAVVVVGVVVVVVEVVV